jgi:rubrerythrin
MSSGAMSRFGTSPWARMTWRIEALVTAYGSDEVRRLLKEWEEQARKIENTDQLIGLVEKFQRPPEQLDNEAQDEHLAIAGYKEALQKARRRAP